MERNLTRSARKRAFGADAEQSPLRERDDTAPRSLFFPSGERRKDLDAQQDDGTSKRFRVDAPVFYSQGLEGGIAASEPVAKDAWMGLATGHLVYYGGYFEQNKLLRELAFERESRQRFGKQTISMEAMTAAGGHGDNDDDDL